MIAAVGEAGPDWTIIGDEDGGGPPCPRCCAEATQRIRKRLSSSVPRWLRSGGPLFSWVRECGACGYRWPGVVFFGRPDAPRWLVPWLAARSAVRAFHDQRTWLPVPWLYVASAGIGAAAGAALGSRRGTPGRSAAVGATSGWVTCWSVFAVSAVRQHGTGSAIADAVLVHVGDPRSNAERHARRQEEQAAGAGFAPYGLDASWQGRRYLAGTATSWARGPQPPRVTELVLGHATGTAAPGAPGWDEGITVSTLAPRGTDGGDDHRWHLTAEELLDDLGGELGRHGGESPRGGRGTHVVHLDGTAMEVPWLHGEDRWVVLVRTADVHVEVRGAGSVPEDLRLERVLDLGAYPSPRT